MESNGNPSEPAAGEESEGPTSDEQKQENQIAAGDTILEEPKDETSVVEPASEHTENEITDTDVMLDKPNEIASESPEVQEVEEPMIEKSEVEPVSKQPERLEEIDDSSEPSDMPKAMTEIPEQSEETAEETSEFAGGLVATIVSAAVEKASDVEFVTGIVSDLVSTAVGEEISKELESGLEPVTSERYMYEVPQDAEDITIDVIRYLGLGPESLKLVEGEPWLPDIPASCICFLNVVEYARRFVDDILEKAKEVCFLKYGIPVKYRKKQVEVQNIRWPSIESFTIDLGTKKIDEYIQMTFEVEENWLYKINFITAQSDLSSDVYLYEAIFCIPTPCYPIAQATVSIYFNCDVSRVKPRECPIDVTYSIESLKETLVPGKTVVNDDMLLRLVYSKLSVFKSLYF